MVVVGFIRGIQLLGVWYRTGAFVVGGGSSLTHFPHDTPHLYPAHLG